MRARLIRRSPSPWLLILALALASAGLGDTVGVSRGSLRSALLPKADIKVSVPSEGIVKAWLVEEGQRVEAGQVLLELESTVESLRIQQAEAAVSGYQAQLERAEKALARVRALSQANIQSDRELEAAEFEAINARSQVKQGEAALGLAKAELAKKSVRSPVDGIFLKGYKQPGEAIGRFETAARVLNVDSLEMIIYASSDYWGKFVAGDTVKIEITSGPYAGTMTEGEVSSADPVIDPVAGTFRVKVAVAPTDRVVMGLYGRLILE